jgi:hypothetical protein
MSYLPRIFIIRREMLLSSIISYLLCKCLIYNSRNPDTKEKREKRRERQRKGGKRSKPMKKGRNRGRRARLRFRGRVFSEKLLNSYCSITTG